ncbi:hypothetical protein [Bradyrhizobium elkanii]|uniref:hypothetical protein n=1 Tax=Bradyrhizobium elkanii TaxID=29448 RepID=UPI00272C64B3|nr:hypothetical protein [Bradyrhizobium elkanii]WLA80287.1 hypothetical protein QNJ99_33615 [Bradyrhizobium elkanii]
MDLLEREIEVFRLCVRINRLRYEIVRNYRMGKVQGVASAMAKLQHKLDDRAEKLLKRVEAAAVRGDAAFEKAHKKLDGDEQAVADVEQFIASLEGSNGGDPLDDSLQPSDQEPQQPQAGWKAG